MNPRESEKEWPIGIGALAMSELLGVLVTNAFLVLVLISTSTSQISSSTWFASCLTAFVVPYVALVNLTGFLADRFSKRSLFVASRVGQIFVLSIAAIVLPGDEVMVISLLILMGAISALATVTKYGLIPELVSGSNLSKGNGILVASRFIAMALGVVIGTVLAKELTSSLVCGLLIGVSIASWVAALLLPRGSAAVLADRLQWNLVMDFKRRTAALWKSRSLYLSAIGVAYAWFLVILLRQIVPQFGQAMLSLAPDDSFERGLLLIVVAGGVALGGLLAALLSAGNVELGLVPIASTGIALSSLFLFWVPGFEHPFSWSVVFLGVLGVSIGMYQVPLLAMLQLRSPRQRVGSHIAATGMLMAVAMMVAAWSAVVIDSPAIRLDWVFLGLGCLAFAATVVTCWLLPEALFRFLFWFCTHSFYRLRVVNRHNVPESGPGLLICNHVSYMDGFFVLSSHHRMIRFVVWAGFADSPYLNWLGRIMGVISISTRSGPKALAAALRTARDTLRRGDLLCIFAEGQISRTGNILRFKRGFEKVIKGVDAPIIPVYLDRVWGSVFSFQGGKVLFKWPREIPYSVTVGFGKPLPPKTDAFRLQQAVQELGAELVRERKPMQKPLHRLFVRNANRHCFRFFNADSSGKELTFGKTLTGTIALSRVLKKQLDEEQMVGVLLPPSVAGSLVNYALLCAGKVPINLNYTASKESIDSSIEQCGIKTIISSPLVLKKLKLDLPIEPIAVERLLKSIGSMDRFMGLLGAYILPGVVTEYLMLGLGSSKMDDLATVIFSSGSTGDPKGVMLTHHNILSNAEGVIQVIDPTPRDRLVGVLPLFHSFGFMANLWVPALVPCGVVCHNNPLDSKVVGELMRKYSGSIFVATPTFLRAYIRRVPAEDFKTLRVLIVGAEKLPRDVAEAFKEKFGVDPLEGYGATELAPVAAVNTPDFVSADGNQIGNKPGTVGHPIPGVVARVVDPDTSKELKAGEAGLLMIKGPNVMKGYLKKPELTSEVIRDGWYVTGDIACIDEDGFITITDRLSRFSKIGGEMVPHIRIEETLQEILQSEDRLVAVTGVPDPSKGERLVVVHTKLDQEIGDLWKKMLDTGLPKLWVPGRDSFFEVEELPHLGTGKLDLRAVKQVAMDCCGVNCGG